MLLRKLSSRCFRIPRGAVFDAPASELAKLLRRFEDLADAREELHYTNRECFGHLMRLPRFLEEVSTIEPRYIASNRLIRMMHLSSTISSCPS